MISQVFTGGHYSSGSRTIQLLLEQKYNTHSTDITRDYEPGFSEKNNTFVEQILRGEKPKFPMPQDRDPEEEPLEKPWSLKNPDFMLAFPYLKKMFPESKTILVVRNGIDQVLCENRSMSHRFAQYYDRLNVDIPDQKTFIGNEMKFWTVVHKYAVKRGKIDLVIRLEDMVHNTKATVKKIKDFLQIHRWPDYSMITKPTSMGRRHQEATVYPYNTGDAQVYTPDMKDELYEIGQEMMEHFGYKD